ncbi:MAG: hypothetical protein J7M24_01795, partial [Candidatus Latescibacteria bacterium]|nr:hypothetical protein [Candidatus Latescibacterota bacterium]
VAVIDTSGVVGRFIAETWGVDCNNFDPSGPPVDYIIVGAHDYNDVRNLGVPKNVRRFDPILERVANGATLIVLENPGRWAERLGAFDYAGVARAGLVSFGSSGRFFTGHDAVLTGLPQDCVMNWEYQAFYHGGESGLRLGRAGVETIVGIAGIRSWEIENALARVRYGSGMVLITTLPILPGLASDAPQDATVKRLFLNMLEYAGGNI